jgi:hypothetical protein
MTEYLFNHGRFAVSPCKATAFLDEALHSRQMREQSQSPRSPAMTGDVSSGNDSFNQGAMA